MIDKVKACLKSRRFWVAISGVVVVLMSDVIGVDVETANKIVAVAVAWIVGDSLRTTE